MSRKIPIHMHPAIALLEWAAIRSYVEDVRTPQVLEALAEVEQMSNYATPFVAYRRALELENPQARWTATLTAFAAIAGAVDIRQLEHALQPTVVVDAANGYRFLMNEAESGLLFADIALKAGCSPQRSRDCVHHARNAYQSILRFQTRANLPEKSATNVEFQVSRLRAALQQLGEVV